MSIQVLGGSGPPRIKSNFYRLKKPKKNPALSRFVSTETLLRSCNRSENCGFSLLRTRETSVMTQIFQQMAMRALKIEGGSLYQRH